MKKKATLIMALALAASVLTGCGGGDNGSSEKNNSSASASAGKNTSADSAGVSTESGQNPAEEVQVGDCTLVKAEGMDAEVRSANLVGYCAQNDTYYAAPNYSGGNSFEQGIMILNSDFSVKEKIDGVISAYPIYGIIHYMDNDGNYFLRIKDKEYSVDYGKVFMSDGVVIYNQTYYSFNGDKLDLPYHGEFYDGKCIYSEKDGTYYCMDLKGNITDITEKVKPITDNSNVAIIASIEDKYYVDYYGQWFYTDGTLVEKTSVMCYGTPARGSDGKYSNGSVVKTMAETGYSEYSGVPKYFYYYIDLSNDEEPLPSGWVYRYDWGGPYVLQSTGSDWVGERPIAYGISEFHNGIALMLDMDYNLYFVNSSYEQISDTLFTITGDDRNDETSNAINNAYIGSGKFTFKANGETYLISAGGSDYYDNNAPKASDIAQEEPAPETESAPVESEQTPAEETKPQNNFPQSVKYTVTKTPLPAYMDEGIDTWYTIEGYSAEYDVYYATQSSWDGVSFSSLKTNYVILNSDYSVKETLDDVKSWYPLYDTIYYKDKDGNRILRIKDKEYPVEKGEVIISDGVIIQNETYYSMDGDKLDLPYHGEFYDGKCFYTEDGKTLCMDLNGNVTDYTEKVKPITDAGYDVAALIDDKYYVSSYNHWFSIDGTDLKVNGMPYKGSDGKYINGNLARIKSIDEYGQVTKCGVIDLASDEMLYDFNSTNMRYEWGADSIWIRENGNYKLWYNSEDKTQNAYALSEFYNGVALTLDKDLNIYLVNYNYDKISDTLATLPEGEEGNAKTLDDAYIGGGRFTFKANNEVYVVTIDG